MKQKLILFVCAATLLCSCGPTLQKQTAKKMQELTTMSELGTVEYTVSKVIKCNDQIWYKVGDRKILFSCQAHLKAGIDMSQFRPENVVVSGRTIEVTLPQPALLSMNMPAEEAKLVYEKTGALRCNFTAQERNLLLQQGEEAIRNDVPNLGILNDAKKNAEMFFTALLKQLGYNTITIKFAAV